uniref:Uncharacterized protein n=1 Tax=Solanum tuberosum TaxID=4113 RepID=M1BRA1_SOLTU
MDVVCSKNEVCMISCGVPYLVKASTLCIFLFNFVQKAVNVSSFQPRILKEYMIKHN